MGRHKEPRDEQFMLSEDGESMELVPMASHGKPSGSTKEFAAYMQSNYPDFLAEISAIGLSIADHSVEEMKRGLAEYLKVCEKYEKPMTNMAMYTAMGITKDIAYDITHGRSGTKEQKQLIIYAKQLCAMHREAMGVAGAMNPILIMFWQKAFDGLNEMTEVTSGTIGGGDDLMREDAETIAEKYAELPD